MKSISIVLFASVVCILSSCSNNEVTKTLYGDWEPILECPDTARNWGPTTKNFLLSVTGKCEEIVVTKMEKGDLTNPDIPMTEAKCFGERDELGFKDTYNTETTYLLKLDVTKDTLIGKATTKWSNAPDEVVKIKFLRISGGE